MNNVSLIVCSCDKYEEIWNPFFVLLNKYWSTFPKPCFLLTETKKCSIDNVVTLNSKGNWSDRLLYSLKHVTQEYAILFLDDFFLMDYVNELEIKRLLGIMADNKDIAVFYFKHSSPQNSNKLEYGSYIKMDSHKKYSINFQVGLWRIDALKEIMHPNKNPWEIEEDIRPKIPEHWRLYCSASSSYINCKNDVFPYLWALQSGYGVCKGRILWNNRSLFKKEGIKYHPINLIWMSRKEYYYLNILSKMSYFIKKIKHFFSAERA